MHNAGYEINGTSHASECYRIALLHYAPMHATVCAASSHHYCPVSITFIHYCGRVPFQRLIQF